MWFVSALIFMVATHASQFKYDDKFLIACANNDPICQSILRTPAPPTYDVSVNTSRGIFTIAVNTSWAPVMSQRFFVLNLLGYFSGSPFYRVLNINPQQRFVAQFGYRGSPVVDSAWIEKQTSNETSFVLQSNSRGTVAFGTSQINNTGLNPNCTAPSCSQGFSVELFINLANNSRLDPMDFSPFGLIEETDMKVVDALYAGYGECSDMCVTAEAKGDPYCFFDNTTGTFAGVNLTAMIADGWSYLHPEFPRLDTVFSTGVH